MHEEREMISIVTVCYNAVGTIQHTLESVLHQTYRPLEYVIKDGGSTDGTVRLIEKYREKMQDRGISVRFVSSKDHGIYDAMNTAVSMCRGQWINFMNADDSFYQNDVIECLMQKKSETSDIIFGDTLMCDVESQNLRYTSMDLIGTKMPFIHQSSFFKKEILGECPYDESYVIAADYNMICGFYRAGKVFEYIPIIVAKYSIEGLSSHNVMTSIRERQQVRLKYGFETSKYCLQFIIERGDARIQSVLLQYCPERLLRGLKRFYKKYIRRYKQLENDEGVHDL